jgi:dTDP-4-dehydrorhamnose 3,5-epimerase
MIEGVKDSQSITADWVRPQELIAGVVLKEVRNVPKDNGMLTEIFRSGWDIGETTVDQIFQVVLSPGAISAWHTHLETLDRLFVTHGLMKVVLYDDRSDSPTHGLVNEFKLGAWRPGLVVVPPGVWHGIQNLHHEPSTILNAVDRAYRYEDPDHWRVPHDSADIPYRFQG